MPSDGKTEETLGHNELNEDLLNQIFLRLPIKSLLRFKRFSKLWLSIISCPKFCDSYTLRNPNPKFSSTFLISRDIKLHRSVSLLFNTNHAPLDFIRLPQELKILQSCNGLLLCSSSTNDSKFYVVNHTTHRFSEIALPPPSPKFPKHMSVALAFDPSKWLHYKLVCVLGSAPAHSKLQKIEVEIYSSQTRTWSVCVSTGMWFPRTGELEIRPGVYCNGKINWLVMNHLAHYDIDEWHYGVVHRWNSYITYSGLGESGGRLHVIEMLSYPNLCNVLEMRNDYSGWFVKYRVDKYCVDPKLVNPHRLTFPILFIDGEENEEGNPVLLLHNKYEVMFYNIKDKSCTTLCTSISSWCGAYQYMETLACV